MEKIERVFNPDLMVEIRNRFTNVNSDPISGKRIYFENAGGTLKLKSILELINFYSSLPDNFGRRNKTSQKMDEAMAKGREDIALLLGARSGKIIGEQSITGMIFRLLNNITHNSGGGNIVTSNLDHASVYDATFFLADRHNLEARIAKLDPESGTVSVESILKHIDNKTVALTIIHSSNNLGTRNDVIKIVEKVRNVNSNMFIIIDGAQHASHGLIDVEAYGADAYIFVPYKTYAKLGISFAYVSDRLALLKHENLAGKPKDFWDLGTREVSAYACMSKVVDYMKWLGSHFTNNSDPRSQVVSGMEAIERHELDLINTLFFGNNDTKGLLDRQEVTIYGEKVNLDKREAIVAFNLGEYPTGDIVDYFETNGIRITNRISNYYSKHTLSELGIEECVRVSLCHYNTIEEINCFLKLLDNYK